MRNWEHFVREHLTLPELAPEREGRVVRELAAQLEDFYRDALARGLSEPDADAFACRQVRDWRGLACEVREADRPNARTYLERLEERAEARDTRWRWNVFANLRRDLRYALRQLRANPGFTSVAVLTLALGIGANSVMFGLIYTVLLRPLPYPEPEDLVLVWQGTKKNPAEYNIVSAPNFLDWQKQNRVFEQLAAAESRSFNLADEADVPAEVPGVRVSSTLFPLLGIQPLLGRTFSEDEDRYGNHRVVVLSQPLWQNRYGGDPEIVGRQIRINGEPHTVVGVMPAEFQFYGAKHELWVPVAFTPRDLAQRQTLSYIVFGRLRSGVTLPQARAEMEALATELESHWENKNQTVRIQPMGEFQVSERRPVLFALFGAVGFVLLIGCANVSSLLLARSATRRREIAIRVALGASRSRIVGQLLTESMLLGLAGGAAGVLLAMWGNRLLPQLYEFDLRFAPFRSLEFTSLDGTVLSFTLAISLLASLLFGVVPALGTSRAHVSDTLKESGTRGGSRRQRTRSVLVIAEVALALVVLAGASLMMRSLEQLFSVAPGFDPRNVLVGRASLPQTDTYGVAERTNFCRDVEERIGSLPGVANVSTVSHLPVTAGPTSRGLTIEGRPLAEGRRYNAGARYRLICPGYFQTMKIPLLRGREFTHADTANAPGVAIVSEAVVRLYWPDDDPIGKRFKQGTFDSDAPWVTVVGVVANIRDFGLDKAYQAVLYRPYPQSAWPVQYVVVRAAGDPRGLIEPVRQAVTKIDPEQPLSGVRTMDDVIAETVSYQSLVFSLLGIFAVLAVALAAVGIYGVMAYAVTERTREIGIRMALGARRLDVFRLVLGGGFAQTVIGVAIGVFGAMALTRFIQGLLFHTAPVDPVAFGGAALLLTAVALLACYVPAVRATRVDPMATLREE